MSSGDEESFSEHFSPLDELIQLIYQGPLKFVVLSSVTDAGWTVHLGLTGPGGRWWKGTWTEKDVDSFIGHHSAKLEGSFGENLAKAFVEGHLYVGNWSAEKGAEIDLTVGTTAKSPVHIPLMEMEHQDAAAYATAVFVDIASQAQERQCHLHPPAFPPVASASTHRATTPPVKSTGTKRKAKDKDEGSGPSPHKTPSKGKAKVDTKHAEEDEKAQAKIRELEAKLARAEEEMKRKASLALNKGEDKLASRAKNAGPAVRPAKGASLANPNKKARRYQALEFEDD